MGLTKMIEPAQALAGRATKTRVDKSHYVLKNAMQGPWPEHLQLMIFANGCFWGSEKGAWRLPGGGIFSTAVGYTAGFTPNPTYEEVCSGRTGHTEAVHVVYDPEKIGTVDILRWFWEAHDPTCGMGQGNDRGTQYRSGLYFVNEEQRQIFEASKNAYEAVLRKAGKGRGSITTEIKEATDFYFAEGYHQQYLAKPGARPYCSAQPQVVSLPPYESWAPSRSLTPEQLAFHAPKLPEGFWKVHGPKPHCVIRSPDAPIVWPSEGAVAGENGCKKANSGCTIC